MKNKELLSTYTDKSVFNYINKQLSFVSFGFVV